MKKNQIYKFVIQALELAQAKGVYTLDEAYNVKIAKDFLIKEMEIDAPKIVEPVKEETQS